MDDPWQPIETAPKDGSTIRVKHELGTYGLGNATASFDAGWWVCSELFIDPNTMRIYRQPTHWMPQEDAAEDEP